MYWIIDHQSALEIGGISVALLLFSWLVWQVFQHEKQAASRLSISQMKGFYVDVDGFAKWLSNLRYSELLGQVVCVALMACWGVWICQSTARDLEAFDSGQVSELEFNFLTEWAYEMFGARGTIITMWVLYVSVILIGVSGILGTLLKLRRSRVDPGNRMPQQES